jgi:inositol phosphorylceramide synthase regulatory subunit
MTLRTGTSLILLVQIINKVTAFYGILALFTSFPLSALQLSMYIYSLPILAATLYLAGPVRAQSAWHCLAFAYVYTLDSIVNAFYTALFGVTWFVVVASPHDQASKAPGGKMMENTGGFSNPEHNVSHVEIVAKPKPGVAPVQDAIAMGAAAAVPAPGGSGFAGVVLNGSSAMSIFIISAFWLLRFYAVFVVLAYARAVLRHYIQVSSLSDFNNIYNNGSKSDLAQDPFAEGSAAGSGWKGRLGRLMVKIGRSYWLGRDPSDHDFVLRPLAGSKFRKSEDIGVLERERRRRSGTGPPAPPPGLTASS